MDPELKGALKQWTKKHTSINFTHNILPITHQIDSFSCGLLAWNALAHFFLPKHYTLIAPADVATGRLDVLLRICTQHQNEVSCIPRHL